MRVRIPLLPLFKFNRNLGLLQSLFAPKTDCFAVSVRVFRIQSDTDTPLRSAACSNNFFSSGINRISIRSDRLSPSTGGRPAFFFFIAK